MRFSASSAANAAAWIVLALLIAAAILLTYRLGFMGLLLLGGATCLVCVMAELDRDVPTWGRDVFNARMTRRIPAEERAAMQADDTAFVAPLRFYRWCGVVLLVTGAVGLAAQVLGWLPAGGS